METFSSFGFSVNSLTSSSYVLLLCSSAFHDRSAGCGGHTAGGGQRAESEREGQTASPEKQDLPSGYGQKGCTGRGKMAEPGKRHAVPFQNAAKWEATDEKETVDDAGALETAGSGVGLWPVFRSASQWQSASVSPSEPVQTLRQGYDPSGYRKMCSCPDIPSPADTSRPPRASRAGSLRLPCKTVFSSPLKPRPRTPSHAPPWKWKP